MNYYESEFSKVRPENTPYFPSVKIFANGNGEDTKNIPIHEESSKELIFWLANNFLNNNSLDECLKRLNRLTDEG